MIGFSAAAAGLGAITAGVMHAIDQGAELDRLHRRLSTDTADLYKLERGFEAAGLSAEDVSPLVFKLQKSLGGMNEMGQSTRVMFNSLGLSLGALNRMKTPDQILAITRALAKMDTESAAAVAGGIFGREGAANMVQLAHSSEKFAGGLAKSAHDAEIWQRAAPSFDRIKTSMGEIESHVGTMFAGMAEGLAPEITAIEDQLKKMNLEGLGEQFGKIFSAIVEAFHEGTLSDLIALSLQTGFEMGVAALPPVLEKIGFMLLKIFETPLEYLQAGMQWVIEKVMEGFYTLESKLPKKLQEYLGINVGAGDAAAKDLADRNRKAYAPGGELYEKIKAQKGLGAADAAWDEVQKNLMDQFGFKADSFSKILADEQKRGLQFNVGTGEFGLKDINKDADKRWEDAKKKMGEIAAPLLAMFNGLAGAHKLAAGTDTKGDKTSSLSGENRYRAQYTSLEKMGFVMGGANLLLDVNRRTATATERSARTLDRIAGLLGGPESPALANQV
jgi:hypothetical protein